MTVRSLSDLASQETIDYALKRSDAYASRHPMVALVYRVVAEVMALEIEARGVQEALAEAEA